jgi:hypothetical protein
MVWEPWYSWEEHYFAAVLETDNAKLPELVDKAHAAIVRRRQELDSDHSGTPDEQLELNHALHGLTVLKKERIEVCLDRDAN